MSIEVARSKVNGWLHCKTGGGDVARPTQPQNCYRFCQCATELSIGPTAIEIARCIKHDDEIGIAKTVPENRLKIFCRRNPVRIEKHVKLTGRKGLKKM